MNCKYCDEETTNKELICNKAECITAERYRCKKILSCLHYCCMSNTSKKCKCLVNKCKNSINYYVSECSICLEENNKYSLIKLDCGHIFHHRCISSILQSNYISKGQRINLLFLKCPLCNEEIKEIKDSPDLNLIINHYNSMKQKIDELIYQYIESDQLEYITKDQNSKYYAKPFEYCKDNFSFYLCYNCEIPYYGGENNCIFNEINEVDNNNLCIYCLGNNNLNLYECEVHERQNLLYKCRFCCNESSHFCLGNIHFCEDCHFKQLTGIDMTKIKLNELDNCNKETCFLKGNHPYNGIEYSYGCMLCYFKN